MLTNGYLDQNQGWSRHFLEIANNLSDLGHQVIIISRNKDITTLAKKCYHISLPAIKYKWLRWIIYVIAWPFAIARAAFSYKCNILLYRQHWSSAIAGLAGWLCHMKIIPEVNSVLFYEYKQDKLASLLTRIIRIVLNSISEFLCYCLSSKVIAVAESIKTDIVNRYSISSEKVFVVYNGANLNVFRPMDKNFCRQKLGLNENSHIITFVGTFFRWQGITTLLRAGHILRSDFPELKILLVGDGEEIERIIRIVEDLNLQTTVIFTNRVDYRIVPIYIGAADICAGRFESAKFSAVGGSPLKIAEYIACGRPVVCSRTRSYWEFIETERLGKLVEPENPIVLTKAFKKLLNDSSELERMEQRCRKYAELHLSWRRAAKEVEKICEESLKTLIFE